MYNMFIGYYLAGAWTLTAIFMVIQSHIWFKEVNKPLPTGLGVYLLASCIFGIMGLMSFPLF